MDQRDVLLFKARAALQATRELLGKILQDDDDAVLSARVIGDTGDQEMPEEKTEETYVQKVRREVSEEIASLAYKRSPQDALAFFDDQTWIEFPAVMKQRIEEYFGHPRYVPYADKVRINSERVVELIENMERITALLYALRQVDRSNDIKWNLKVSHERYEALLRRNETAEQTLRRHAFKQAADMTGKPEKAFEKIFNRIDWKALKNNRFAELRALLFSDLPEYDYSEAPSEERAWRQWRANNRAASAAAENAARLQPALEILFYSLRGDIAREQWRAKQAKRAAKAA